MIRNQKPPKLSTLPDIDRESLATTVTYTYFVGASSYEGLLCFLPYEGTDRTSSLEPMAKLSGI